MQRSIWVARYLRRLRDMCLETDGAWALEHLDRWMHDSAMLNRLEEDFEDPVKAAESVIHMELEVTRMSGEWTAATLPEGGVSTPRLRYGR